MYRSVAQLDSLAQLLSTWFPGYFTRFALPEPSVEGRPVHALRLRAGGGGERRGVMVVGGTHSRELMNPDAIVELAVDLFVSHVNGSDVTYGNRTWSAAEIKLILETLDLWLVPCMNPDGREYVMNVDNLWRKNRRDNPGTSCDGVDLNRNFDVVWGVTQGQTSCAQCSEVFCGPQAFSEPETRNIRSVLDTRRVDCFVDVHSYSELVLWPWGHAPSQTTDPAKRFTTLPSGTCAPISVAGYQEYIPPRDLQRFQTVGSRIVSAIAAVRGRTYTSEPSIALYATTGTQSDYAYARHIANPKLRKTYGFTFETGPWAGTVAESFHPADPTLVKRDAKAGIIALMQQCICAIELIGARFFATDAEVAALRRIRDEVLATTEAGRAWIALFEGSQLSLLTTLMANEQLSSQAAALVERAAELTRTTRARIRNEDVDEAIRFLRALGKAQEDADVRAGLRAVERRLEALRGLTSARALASLTAEPPAGRAASRSRRRG
ncbi:MAG TPA: M14 family zinc carboxypeptidase [Gaiella sp.]|nr:M14 family zinc carboxypeptidase [Gaiella sp.]